MKLKFLIAIGLVIVLAFGITVVVGAVSGAAFTTFNPSVDGDPTEICKNSIINCNIYSSKEYVWLNGGPDANGLGPEGTYFFAVLVPGGQPDPNDGVAKNLSDDYDTYENRRFMVNDQGEVSAYISDADSTTEDHWVDSGSRNACATKGKGPSSCEKTDPDDSPPYIRLFPYADTTNPGGVYIMAICKLPDDMTNFSGVNPRDCKYDAFKVKENGPVTASLVLSGMKFEDVYADGKADWVFPDYKDPGLEEWQIYIYGTGMMGETIDEYVKTDSNGAWDFQKDYTYKNKEELVEIQLTVCEVQQGGWTQSFPETEDGCYDVKIPPAALAKRDELDFGNWQPVDVTACKVRDMDGEEGGETIPVKNWTVSLTKENEVIDTQLTGEDGCYTWTEYPAGEPLKPGFSYDVHEGSEAGWEALGPMDFVFEKAKSGDSFSHTFINAVLEGCTPGFWGGGADSNDTGKQQWLWNEVNDEDWVAAGGIPYNPYIWTKLFNDYFTPVSPGLDGVDMHSLVNTGGGDDNYRKAARSLVAAYLNSSFGMNYPYTTDELYKKWSDAVDSGEFLALHIELDGYNNAYADTNRDGIIDKNTEHQCMIP